MGFVSIIIQDTTEQQEAPTFKYIKGNIFQQKFHQKNIQKIKKHVR